MEFKPFKNYMQIQTMDEYVFWEETGNCADEVPIEELNAFFREYVKKHGYNEWQSEKKEKVKVE